VDRLATWLNAQRGWRLYGLVCLYALPIALLFSAIFNANWGLFSTAPPRPATLAAAAALAVPGALALAGLLLWLHSLAARRAQKHVKRGYPMLAWRMFAYLYLFVSGADINILSDTPQEPPQLHQSHAHEVFVITMCLTVASFVFLGWQFWYLRRLRQRSGGGVVRASW
jgi:hypothetical protein